MLDSDPIRFNEAGSKDLKKSQEYPGAFALTVPSLYTLTLCILLGFTLWIDFPNQQSLYCLYTRPFSIHIPILQFAKLCVQVAKIHSELLDGEPSMIGTDQNVAFQDDTSSDSEDSGLEGVL